MRKYCSRVVVENFFEPCILYLILQKPSYGYKIFSNLKNHCDCDVNIGNLYRCLSRLQKEKFVIKNTLKSKIGPKRSIYKITNIGERLLKEWIDEIEIQTDTMEKLIKNYHNLYETDIKK